jgi:phage terminase large subunit
MEVALVPKSIPVLGSQSRYKILYGGRASAKSWSIARYLVTLAAFYPKRVLCTREMQNSIKDSVYRLLVDQINYLKLVPFYDIRSDGIRGKYGSEFLFKGLRHNISEVKSTEGIDICWCEEAEKISEDSWTILIPTIRQPKSEILISFNPEDENSPTYTRFVKQPPPDSSSAEITYLDNPWFPEVLRKEMEYDRRVDQEKYEFVWLGKPKRYSQACIFKGKVRVEDFDSPGPEDGVQFYFGADFGFSVDPTVLGRMFIRDSRLYIDYEAFGHGVELDDLHQFFASVPDSDKWKIIADSQRPDTISFLTRPFKAKNGTYYPGYNIVGAEKGKGSVEDGIQFLRGFEEIVVHPRCTGAKDNFENYKWKQDKITNEVLPIPEKGSDHWPDAARYALEPYTKAKVSIFDVFGGTE